MGEASARFVMQQIFIHIDGTARLVEWLR
jgi:hypothetical protein